MTDDDDDAAARWKVAASDTDADDDDDASRGALTTMLIDAHRSRANGRGFERMMGRRANATTKSNAPPTRTTKDLKYQTVRCRCTANRVKIGREG